MIRNVTVIIDGEAGSCGKAKVVGEIATDKRINLDRYSKSVFFML